MACLGLLAVTWIVFGQVLGFDFINYDDPLYVTGNRHVMEGLGWDGLVWAFRTGWAANWHPVTWLSHMTDVSLFGLAPGAHHAMNVVFHGANAVLLFLLLRGMTRRFWPCLAVAVLFAVHPLHVESVAWVAERKDVLSMFLGLLTLRAYLAYVRTGSASRLVWASLLFFLGLMAKPMLVSLPLLLLLLDRWPLERKAGPVRLLLEKVPFAAMAIVSCVITFQAQRAGGAVHTLKGLPLSWRALNAVSSLGAYLVKAFLPFRLSPFYPFPTARTLAWTAPLAALFVIAASVAVWRQRRRRPYLLFGWLWYLVTVAPVIGIVQVGLQGMADRYTYLPLVGPGVALAWFAAERLEGSRIPRRAAALGAVGLTAALMVLSWAQARVWRTSETLFRHAVALDPGNLFGQTNLGFALLTEGRCAEAVPHLQAAVRIMPGIAKPHYFLGRALLAVGRRDEALVAFKEALDVDPRYYDVMFDAAEPLVELGRDREAWALLSAFLAGEPQRLQGEGDPRREQARSRRARALMEVIRTRH